MVEKWFSFWGYLGDLHYFFDFGAKIVQFHYTNAWCAVLRG